MEASARLQPERYIRSERLLELLVEEDTVDQFRGLVGEERQFISPLDIGSVSVLIRPSTIQRGKGGARCEDSVAWPLP